MSRAMRGRAWLWPAVAMAFAGTVACGEGGALAPSFKPPAEFDGQFGSYKSPLKFDDGTPVKTAADWQWQANLLSGSRSSSRPFGQTAPTVPFVPLPILLIPLILSHVVAGVHDPVWPRKEWTSRSPDQLGLDRAKLDALAQLVGGRGCVVRRGYMAYTWGEYTKSGDVASAVKPVIGTLLLFALQEGKLKSVDDPVADFEPRLRELNGGKDSAITWRHLASQTSGYGLAEKAGAAYAYNDFALALYYDALTEKVFKDDGRNVLKTRLADALQFEDTYSFDRPRAGRLAISCRDFARFGLLILRGGKWGDRQLVRPDLVKMYLSNPIPATTPRSSGRDADMLPDQRSLGGGKNQTAAGPGFYSFNWWINRTGKDDRRFYADAPADAFIAAGHGGKRMLWVIPSLDLIVVWNDSPLDDHDASIGNPSTKCNQAARLMREAVGEK